MLVTGALGDGSENAGLAHERERRFTVYKLRAPGRGSSCYLAWQTETRKNFRGNERRDFPNVVATQGQHIEA